MTTATGSRRRVIAASLIGTSLEWYDFFLYSSAAALVFGKLFFPTFDPLTGTLLAFATHAVAFVARPLGGIVFGHFGDRVGRRGVLVATLVLMGTATMLWSVRSRCGRCRPGTARRGRCRSGGRVRRGIPRCRRAGR